MNTDAKLPNKSISEPSTVVNLKDYSHDQAGFSLGM